MRWKTMRRPDPSDLAIWGFAVAALVAVIYFLQWRSMENTMRIDQRAWVMESEVNVYFPIANDRPQLIGCNTTIHNAGKTPARIELARSGCEIGIGPLPNFSLLDLPESTVTSKAVIPPGGTDILIRQIPVGMSSEEFISTIKKLNKTVKAFGRIKYVDMFGEHHFTDFCYIYTPYKEKPEACNQGNNFN